MKSRLRKRGFFSEPFSKQPCLANPSVLSAIAKKLLFTWALLSITTSAAPQARMAEQARAAPAESSWNEQLRKAHPDIAELLDLARMAPPELLAKTMLQIANFPQLKNREWKKKILLEAFETGALVRELVPRTTIVHWPIGTRAELQDLVFEERIDRLSLQSAAVEEMLAIDLRTAKELHQRMSSMALEPLTCADALVQDPSAHYELLGEVVKKAFNSKEHQAQQHVHLLSDRIRRMQSPVELAPMSRVLRKAPLNIEELTLLSSHFAAVLANMETGDRPFFFSLSKTDNEIHQLVHFLRSREIASESLISAYRAYLIRGLTAERCADNVDSETERKAIARFNEQLSSVGNETLAPLRPAELKPAKVGSEPDPQPLFDSPPMRNFLEGIISLAMDSFRRSLSKSINKPLEIAESEEEITAKEDEQLHQLLQILDNMQPLPGEDNERYLLRKGYAFAAVIQLKPSGPQAEKLTFAYVDFLSSVTSSPNNLFAWLGSLRGLLDYRTTGDAELHKLLLEALSKSGSPALALYARLERMKETETQKESVQHR